MASCAKRSNTIPRTAGERALALIAAGKLDLEPLAYLRYPLDALRRGDSTFARQAGDQDSLLAVGTIVWVRSSIDEPSAGQGADPLAGYPLFLSAVR